MSHETHPELPSGFSFADRLQVESFMQSGSVPGASKVCLVGDGTGPPRLATRLRPPRDEAYAAEYREGWADTAGRARLSHSSMSAFSDGFRDRQEGRMKWHLAHCPDHGDHETGCHA